MADNLTHGLAAALLAQAGLRQRYGTVATLALVIGSQLPDLDALYRFADPVTNFVQHRGITHSLLGGLGLAILGAAVLWGVWRRQPYRRQVGLVYLGVLLHIFMDYVTSYGTQIFLPFDAGRYTSDTVFIVDYTYTAIMITGLVLVRMVQKQEQRRYLALMPVWLLLGAAFWLSAAALSEASAVGLPSLSHSGPYLTLGATLMLGAPVVMRQRDRAWCQRFGLQGGVWLLFAVGLWLSMPHIVPLPLLAMARQSAGAHVIVCSVLVLLAAWWSRCWPARRAVFFGRLGVTVLAAYLTLCALGHLEARRQMAHTLGTQMETVRHLSALPLPGGGAFHWRAIAETDQTYLVSWVSLLPPAVTPAQSIPKGPDNEVMRRLREYRLVRIFWDFARFPVVTWDTQGTETLVRFADLRFSGNGRGRSWFDLTVRLNQAGEARAIDFLNRTFQPHDPAFAAPSSGW